MNYTQQGDVLVKEIELPKKLNPVSGDLLYKGENHHHRLNGGKFQLFTDGTTTFLKVDDDTNLIHEEHKPISLSKGNYRIDIVNEFDHFLEESRKVID